MLTEVSGASKVVSNKKFNIQKTILRIPNLIEVQFYLQHSRPPHQFLIGPRMMDLHWSWESSPSPRGFTIKCFIQLVVLLKFVSTFSPWLIFRFSSESGSYTTTTLQLTHGSFSPSQSSNSLKTDLNKLRLLHFCNCDCDCCNSQVRAKK